jgi:hypothetical protein
MHDLEPHGDESYCDDNEDCPLRPSQVGDILMLTGTDLLLDLTASVVLESGHTVELKGYQYRCPGKYNTQPAYELKNLLRFMLLHAAKSEPKQHEHATKDEAD